MQIVYKHQERCLWHLSASTAPSKLHLRTIPYNQSSINEDKEYCNTADNPINSLHHQDHKILNTWWLGCFGHCSTSTKPMRRVKLVSLLVVETLFEWFISIGLVKDTVLLALVAVSFGYASGFVAYVIGHMSAHITSACYNYYLVWTASTITHGITLLAPFCVVLQWRRFQSLEQANT